VKPVYTALLAPHPQQWNPLSHDVLKRPQIERDRHRHIHRARPFSHCSRTRPAGRLRGSPRPAPRAPVPKSPAGTRPPGRSGPRPRPSEPIESWSEIRRGLVNPPAADMRWIGLGQTIAAPRSAMRGNRAVTPFSVSSGVNQRPPLTNSGTPRALPNATRVS
jgi:hypothetical protein